MAHREVGTARSSDEIGELDRKDSVERRGSRSMELLAGKMNKTLSLLWISTKRQRIAKLAKENPTRVFTSLAHLIDLDWLQAAHELTRKDGATGVDRQSAAEYAENLQSNLESLLSRAKSGAYQAPPVRRVHIPKGNDGATRPIGIPTFEDKVLQRAVAMLLECVYEQDFLDCSYGFRPRRGALGATDAAREAIAEMRGGTVVELDIKKFFDTLDHRQLREFLALRMRDGVLTRLICKWLNAGVMEAGTVTRTELGTPQGGVISPLLANIYLHYVLDQWFAQEVQPRLRGAAKLVRYADDAVIVCKLATDAERLMTVLPKRFARFGLTLHPDKTRLVRFERPALGEVPKCDNGDKGECRESFDFLGFTFYWGRSRKGFWVVRRKTAKDRLSRAITGINDWCRENRHAPFGEQHKTLCSKINGHCEYYGVTGNSRSLSQFVYAVIGIWQNWLGRRSGHANRTWQWYYALLRRLPLPNPYIAHKAVF